ncbi:MAG: hypothetical protein R3C19_22600 [Planctomycetaceae bacterium]
MSNAESDHSQPASASRSAAAVGEARISNTVAVTGLVLTVVAAGLYVLLFAAVGSLPGDPEEFGASVTTAVQVRLVVLASAAGVVNIIGLTLCAVGLFLPDRPRVLAAIGSLVSFLLLAGILGVLAIGVVMQKPSAPVGTNAAAIRLSAVEAAT